MKFSMQVQQMDHIVVAAIIQIIVIQMKLF